MQKKFKKIVLPLAAGLAGTVMIAGLYLQQPKFGNTPKGAYLEKMKKSPNYIGGKFVNLVPTPQFREGTTMFSATSSFVFSEKTRPAPAQSVPTVKTDLLALPVKKDIAVWLGHSSYYLQIAGKRILVDPVLSSSAAPLPFLNRSFEGADIYAPEDFPDIDYLLITHDHWDHLDYPTVMALKSKIKKIISPLGVGGYFEQWGFARDIIHEGDWYDSFQLDKDFSVTIAPARHFSGRLFERNKTLWSGYAIITPGRKVFISGDGGYAGHFKEFGDKFSGFDLAIIENGQYDARWPYIHMMPEEAAQACEDVQTKAALPAHAGKFSIANHAWDEPFERIDRASKTKQFRLLTPKIGELIDLEDENQHFDKWWQQIK